MCFVCVLSVNVGGVFENATNAFHLERIQFVHLILGQLYGFKSVHELGYED